MAKSKSGNVMSCALIDFLQTLQPQHPVMHPGMRDAGTENISE